MCKACCILSGLFLTYVSSGVSRSGRNSTQSLQLSEYIAIVRRQVILLSPTSPPAVVKITGLLAA